MLAVMTPPVAHGRLRTFERHPRSDATIHAHAVMAVNIRDAVVKTNTAPRPISTLIVKNPVDSGFLFAKTGGLPRAVAATTLHTSNHPIPQFSYAVNP